MPIFVRENNEENNEKAVKVFTDRIEPREVFWRNYNLIKDSIKNDQPIPIQVITYYGIGGVGKSSLLKELRKEIDERENQTKYCYIDFEKLLRVKDDVLGILNAIKAQLSSKYKFEFPFFDLAGYEYNIKMGVEASKPELQGIFSQNKELNFLISVINEIPLIGTFTKIASFIDEGNSLFRKRFKDKKLQETFKELDKLDLDELKEILPYYFAKDLQNNLKDEKLPFVFQFDTYERIVNELTTVGSITKIDNWLKSPNGLVRNIPNVLWVIAGREKLKWEEEDKNWKGTLEQHLLGDLSFIDSSSFLKTAGITNEKLIENIYETTSGIPMYLDMCVDTYYKSLEQNNNVNVDDFLGDKTKLIERFFTYMNDQEKDFVTILSFIGNWTDENIESQIKAVLGSFSFSLYEKIKNFSFVLHEEDNYKIHETIRKVVKSEASEIIKNKFNKAIKERQEEKISKIEKEKPQALKSEEKENNSSKEEIVPLKREKQRKEEYKEIIDEIVQDIEEFLYQQPEFNKQTKKEYCEKVSNLIEKLENYEKLFCKIYSIDSLENIINNKTFSQTYEYKRLYSWFVAEVRYLDYSKSCKNSYYKSKYEFTYNQTLKIYNETKNLYKEPVEKLKPIIYTISLFIYKFLTNMSYKACNKKENLYLRSYELYIYKKILKDYLHDNPEIDMAYIKLLYLKNDIKEFNGEYKKFFKKYQDSKDTTIKKFIVKLGLYFLYEEFKGKTGEGYIFKQYNERKEALEEYKNRNLKLIRKEDQEEFIKYYISNKKEKFIEKYLGKLANMIYLDRNLISDDVDNLNLLCLVLQSLDDEPASDEIKLKLFDIFIKLKNDIFSTNDKELISIYEKIIYSYSKFNFNYYFINDDFSLFSDKFIKENKEQFEKIAIDSVNTLKEIGKKYQELVGEGEDEIRVECEEITYLYSLFYNNLTDSLEIYKKYREKYNVYDEPILKITKNWFGAIGNILLNPFSRTF